MFPLVVLLTVLLGWVGLAQAQVIETNEWDNKSRARWSYSNAAVNLAPSISSTTNTCPGGNRLRSEYLAGTYTSSISGGRAEYSPVGDYTELYWGHWFQYSNPFTWNPVGTKIDYWDTRYSYVFNGTNYRDNFLLLSHFQGNEGFTFTQQLGNPPGTQNRYANRATIPINPGTCYWLEIHARMNDVGTPNGLLEVWVDDILIMQHSDVTFRTTANNVWGGLKHSPEWGGGGGTIPQNQYLYFDHTVISTTRIGMPGGSTTDTTPPAVPSNFQVN